jgi:hypothetical protein
MISGSVFKQLTLNDLPGAQRQCAGYTPEGRRCKHVALSGNEFCRAHLPRIKNGHGKKFDSVEQYLASLSPKRKAEFLDGNEIRRVARSCGLSTEDARSQLKKCGYVKTTNKRGISYWVSENDL